MKSPLATLDVTARAKRAFHGMRKEMPPFGLCVHTTGSQVPVDARDQKRPAMEVALDIYTRGPNAAHYVIDHDGVLAQVVPENVIAWHAGRYGPRGEDRRAQYLSGEWKKLCSPTAVAKWEARWAPKYASPQHLYPGESANAAYCFDASTRVLTGDLRWVPIGELVVGDRLIGFHEDLRSPNTTTPADVTFCETIRKPRVRVVTTHGDLTCSTDHLFVGTLGAAGSAEWLQADQLRVGSRLRYFATPWSEDTSFDGGWLSGILDGEGHWSKSGELNIAQNVGPVLDRILAVLTRKEVAFRVDSRVDADSTDNMRRVVLLKKYMGLEHVGRFRPVRMLTKAEDRWTDRRVFSKLTEKPVVLAVEPLTDGEVVAIKTTSRTFIAEGFLSHNCGVELIPTIRGLGTPSPTSGGVFTEAQYEMLIKLAADLATRHGWPAGWAQTPRLVSHEDVGLIDRHDKHGGWDVGFLRTKPVFDFPRVREALTP